MGTNRPPKYAPFETKGPVLRVFIINYTDYQVLNFFPFKWKTFLAYFLFIWNLFHNFVAH